LNRDFLNTGVTRVARGSSLYRHNMCLVRGLSAVMHKKIVRSVGVPPSVGRQKFHQSFCRYAAR